MRVRRFKRADVVGGRRDGRERELDVSGKSRRGPSGKQLRQRRRNLRRLHDRRAVHRLRLASEGKLVLLPGGSGQLLPEAGVHLPGRLEQQWRKREQQRQWKRRDQHVRQLHERLASNLQPLLL